MNLNICWKSDASELYTKAEKRGNATESRYKQELKECRDPELQDATVRGGGIDKRPDFIL
jgi:hypothetical protein